MSLRHISLLTLAFTIGPILGCSSARNPTGYDDLWSIEGSSSTPDPLPALRPSTDSAPPSPGALGVELAETESERPSFLAPINGEFRWVQESGLATNDAVAETTEDRMPWRFNLNLYGWLPQAPAKITIDHNVVQLPEKLDTILDSLQFFVMADFSARKGPFGLYVSPVLLFLRDSMHMQGPAVRHRVSIKEDALLMDFGVSYEIGRWHLGASETESRFPQLGDIAELAVEPFVGARWLTDEIKIDLDPGPSLSPDIKFIAPVVGLRTHWRFTEHWVARIEGDFGGFDVDHLKNTYNFTGALGYRWKTRKEVYWHVFAGYRYLDIHYDDTNTAELEVAIKGPFLGIGVEF